MKKLIISLIAVAGVCFAANYTPVSQEGTAATATITAATIATATIGTSLVLTNTGTVKVSGVTCVTTNQAFINGAGTTNTAVIVDGLITVIQ